MATTTESVNTKENYSPISSDVKSPPSKKVKTDKTETTKDTTQTPVLRFTKLTENATTPTYTSDKAAGVDLYSACDYTIPANGRCLVATDIQIAVPDGCYGRIAERSDLATQSSIDVGAGVIDPDYRGNIKVLLINNNIEDFIVNKGDRIAQLICERYERCTLLETDLDATDRGNDGFGSTEE